PTPSTQDRTLTDTIARLAADLGLRLLDHIIVTAATCSSFRALGLL
ncbi:MAG: JAB domain-containing protein, partial [Desulfomicrobium sp.]|nr:JAB domain-containing protein [Desulfomicrobium sp.]